MWYQGLNGILDTPEDWNGFDDLAIGVPGKGQETITRNCNFY
jgi:hypothetical protein